MKAEIVDKVQFTRAEEERAKKVSQEITGLIKAITKEERYLSQNLVKLGTFLFEVKTRQYWRLLGVPTFESYVVQVGKEVGKGRSQLYGYMSVIEQLGDKVGTERLQLMGKTKAMELAKIVRQVGKTPSDSIINKAMDDNVTIEELKKALFEEYHIKDNEKEQFFALGGFYATSEELMEIAHAMDIAMKTDPVIDQTLPVHIQRKEIMLRFAREYLAEWEARVARGEG